MGGVCSRGTNKKIAKVGDKTAAFPGKLKTVKGVNSLKENDVDGYGNTRPRYEYDSGELQFPFSSELKPLKETASIKENQKASFLGRAGVAGLEKAVEVLDTLGSSMSSLNTNSGFISGVASRGNRISILAFEVANTIAKGSNLFHSLSDENIQFLKKEILHSEGVKNLVSTDMKELLRIAASDKREELDVFLQETIRFGNLCKDPQWHNLDRYFSNLDSDFLNHRQLREEAERRMQELTSLAHHTSELYHELHALDRFEQDYQRKVEEVESLNLPRRGQSLAFLQSELKQQKRLVRSLKKKSLWSRSLEEIAEKLVDVATYMHRAILEGFGNNGIKMDCSCKEPSEIPQRLGVAGLALHYANIINQIDNIAARPTSLPRNTRDTLYHGLPTKVKASLRSRLQAAETKEEVSAFQVKGEMETTLQWLVPVATNTTKAHQGFGWVGEWANTGHEFGKSSGANNNLTRLQTLYYADKQKTEEYILELVICLHRLFCTVRHRDHNFYPLPTRSPSKKGIILHSKLQQALSLNNGTKNDRIQILQEEQNLLDKVSGNRFIPGLSKSQEWSKAITKKTKVLSLSKSAGNSPTRDIIEPPKSNINMLDIMDGLDSGF